MALTPTDPKKDTIYIDVDDEITTIIDKLQHTDQRIVALVLPKRASVLQSIVNMKLLKRTAEAGKKHVVLITSEAGLLPLAGAVGLHVASNLQSRPAIPPAPGTREDFGADLAASQATDIAKLDDLATDDDQLTDDFNPDDEADKPVGQLAGLGAAAAAVSTAQAYNEPETIELDNDDEVVNAAAGGAAVATAVAVKKNKNKKLRVPNFNKFRLILILGIVIVVLLIGGFVYANAVLPKATISLATNSSDIATKANVTLDPTATALDLSTDTVPAVIASKQQTANQQVSTTGQKNNGTKAQGTVTMSSQVCGSAVATSSSPDSVPAGTGVSSGGQTFITQEETTFPDSGTFKNGCVTYQADNSTDVTAQSAGAAYNIAPGTFTVADRSDVTAKSSDAFSGGTDNIVKIVTQADIDNATQKINSAATSSTSLKSDLTTTLEGKGYFAITSSLNAGTPTITTSANVGDQADTVTVTEATTYTMYGARQADLTKIITTNVTSQINPSEQQILKDGSDTAKYQITSPVSSGSLQLTMTATSLAGPDIQTDKLAAQLAGKKTGDVDTIVKAIPGVTDVDVKYSPFWVSSVPKKLSRVTIVVEKAAQSDGSN
jgi:hypothetical protein